MIAHALAKAFIARGWSVGFAGLIKPERWRGTASLDTALNETGMRTLVRSWYAKRTCSRSDEIAIAGAVAEMDPDIIYCYNSEAARLARRAKPRGYIIATSYDPSYITAIHKGLVEFRSGNWLAKIRVVRKIPSIFHRWYTDAPQEICRLRDADAIITYTHNSGVYYAKRLGQSVKYFPLPLELIEPIQRRPRHNPPAFLLAGNVNTTPSLTGFYFFRNHVLPHLSDALSRRELQIRVVGGGKLPQDLTDTLAGYSGVIFLGFVSHEELLDEYARAVALLVPTPMYIGSRSRIVDAFRHGVPTIVHAANQSGFKELSHERNCLMTANGVQFAQFMHEALANPEKMESIASTAYYEFKTFYSADVFCEFVIKMASA